MPLQPFHCRESADALSFRAPANTKASIMPDISVEPGSVQFGGAMWLELEQEIVQAEARVTRQLTRIAHLVAEGHQVSLARKQLIAMIDDLSFLKKLSVRKNWLAQRVFSDRPARRQCRDSIRIIVERPMIYPSRYAGTLSS